MAARALDRGLDFAEVLTVGLPFCAFMIATGRRISELPVVGPLGWGLLALGVLDLLFNAANGAWVLVAGRRPGPVCCLHALLSVGRPPGSRWAEVGLALDAALSFSLVAGMIAFSQMPTLTGPWGQILNVAVVLNVLGAGGLRLAKALDPAAGAH